MNFSDSFNSNNRLCHFSPDGTSLAHVDGHYKLFIRNARTLTVQQMFTCLDEISHISWSPDSSMVLCAMYKRALVQIFSLENTDWTCKIDEGSYGLVSAVWSSDSLSVLTTSEFSLRITVWSLTTKSVAYIKYPKAIPAPIQFSEDGQYMALAERRECADHVSVFLVSNWTLASHFATESSDLQSIRWTPDSVTIAVLDTCTEVRLLFYSVLGHLVSKMEPYLNGLGIKTIAFSPSGQLAAAGFYNQSIHIIPHMTWKSITRLKHPSAITAPTPKPPNPPTSAENTTASSMTADSTAVSCTGETAAGRKKEFVTVYKETDYRMDVLSASPIVNMQPSGPLKVKQVRYELVEQRPFDIPFTTPDPEKPNPKLGPGLLSFSCNGLYLMSRNDNQPCTVYIWNIRTLSLDSVLQHNEPITAAQWDPVHCRLAMLTGTPKVFMWSPEGCMAVRIVETGRSVPNGVDIRWHPDGHHLAVIAKHAFFMCYIQQPQQHLQSRNGKESGAPLQVQQKVLEA